MNRMYLPFAACVLCLFGILATAMQTANPSSMPNPSPQRKAQQSTSAGKNHAEADEGAKRFETHCSRCHNAPQELSPRVARTVVRHMRTRAMLSREDERLILEYLAP